MTTAQYLKALKKLDLTPASQLTAELLGISLRHAQRIAAGVPVPEPVARLLQMYQRHGIPEEWRDG